MDANPVEAIIFHRRHASVYTGVLEAVLQSVVPSLTAEARRFMFGDEFEARTVPGSTADLLDGLGTLVVEHDAIGVFVIHVR